MKQNIHPKYYPKAKVTCACGATWETGSTKPEIRTDVCSKCHPFYTGESQRIVDRAGQVDRFNRRFEVARGRREEAEVREASKTRRARERALVEVVDADGDVEPIEGLPTSQG
jgi:large subunit ribosomal protein L31